jgi:2-iminobutanoate/2-iminopropanoate deaminase
MSHSILQMMVYDITLGMRAERPTARWEAHYPPGSDRMLRTAVSTAGAPRPVGAYSQGILVTADRTLYLAGQLPIDPTSGVVVAIGDIAAQTERVLDNVNAILRAAEMSFDNLVRVGVYLARAEDFEVVNALYGKRFSSSRPARTTIIVARFRIDVLLEIDGIAAG